MGKIPKAETTQANNASYSSNEKPLTSDSQSEVINQAQNEELPSFVIDTKPSYNPPKKYLTMEDFDKMPKLDFSKFSLIPNGRSKYNDSSQSYYSDKKIDFKPSALNAEESIIEPAGQNVSNSTPSNFTNDTSSNSKTPTSTTGSKDKIKTISSGKYLTDDQLDFKVDLSGFEPLPNGRSKFNNSSQKYLSDKKIDFKPSADTKEENFTYTPNKNITEKVDLQLGSISIKATTTSNATQSSNSDLINPDQFIIDLDESTDSSSGDSSEETDDYDEIEEEEFYMSEEQEQDQLSFVSLNAKRKKSPSKIRKSVAFDDDFEPSDDIIKDYFDNIKSQDDSSQYFNDVSMRSNTMDYSKFSLGENSNSDDDDDLESMNFDDEFGAILDEFDVNRKYLIKPQTPKKSSKSNYHDKVKTTKEKKTKKNKPERKKKVKEIPRLNNIDIHLVHKKIKNLVSDRSMSSLWLWPMNKRDRKLVRLLSFEYNLVCKSSGNGYHRHPILTKTKNTGFPRNENSSIKQILDLASKVDKNDYEGKSIPNRISKKTFSGSRGFDFSSFQLGVPLDTNNTKVVGEGVKSIGDSNKGHQMLAKMGWNPGESLGTKGDGIVDPVKAVMRDARRGLGA
ncbi:Protein SQS1 [Smittium culicis]|uniref:Protein SQS1 n=1 Tax=Smittium culicis TaxID=133412 RepID=A0A1R1XKS2_9FUNG|nr:Protein SQS1 [Smittium culicis]